MKQFISEDELHNFEGWLRYQGMALSALQSNELEMWRTFFEEVQEKRRSTAKMGLINFKPKHGDSLYAVAVRDNIEVWLVLWVRRSSKGDVYVFIPRTDPNWDPHSTYHKDGTSHHKSHRRVLLRKKRQPPTAAFRGTEQIVSQSGFGPKTVGATFDPSCFNGIIEIAPGILGPVHGSVAVDLVEPGFDPLPSGANSKLVYRETFKEAIPWLVISVFAEVF